MQQQQELLSHVTKTVELKEEQEEVEEKKGKRCTSLCQYAHKIKSVCGCKGVNHGIKSMVKMDAFFAAAAEEKEVVVA